MINEDMIKALRCVANSNKEFAYCYAHEYNINVKKGEPVMACCDTTMNDSVIPCPYYQSTYGVCYEDDELSELANELANDLEQILKERGETVQL